MARRKEITLETDLRGEGTRRGELFADEIAGGDVRHAEQARQPRGVGHLADAGTAEEHPLHVPIHGGERPPREALRRSRARRINS